MINWKDTIVEEARRQEREAAANRHRLIQAAKDQRGAAGGFNRLMVRIGNLLVSSGRSLQGLDPIRTKSQAPSTTRLKDAKV